MRIATSAARKEASVPGRADRNFSQIGLRSLKPARIDLDQMLLVSGANIPDPCEGGMIERSSSQRMSQRTRRPGSLWCWQAVRIIP